MVYIYKKAAGGKNYFYLRASERKGDKVLVKDIAYLGSSITDVEISLQKLPQFDEKIRKAYKTIRNFLQSNHYLEKAEELKLKQDEFLSKKLNEVEACKLHYNFEFQKNQELTKKEILDNFILEFAFNTASIEGNTIKLQEARNLLQEGLTPKNRTLREIYDLQNTEKCFLNLLTISEEIGHSLIINIHSQLMENLDSRTGYRLQDVRVIKANFKATPAPYVKTDMDLLLKWYNQYKEKLHPLVLATIFHHKFERIHPFMDGNGRTGRMLLNYILLQNKYPPLVIHNKARTEYLKTLRKADNSKPFETLKADYQELLHFVAEEMINTYWGLFL
ncbi:Fic family protein [Candidatus Woesearchaeota archaeon]|nr:Fic family protein [Candidatus Woesearchaeota archaeon]